MRKYVEKYVELGYGPSKIFTNFSAEGENVFCRNMINAFCRKISITLRSVLEVQPVRAEWRMRGWMQASKQASSYAGRWRRCYLEAGRQHRKLRATNQFLIASVATSTKFCSALTSLPVQTSLTSRFYTLCIRTLVRAWIHTICKFCYYRNLHFASKCLSALLPATI